MKKWNHDTIPQHTIMIKYLAKIMTKAELRDLLKRYMKAKQTTLSSKTTKKDARSTFATDPEK